MTPPDCHCEERQRRGNPGVWANGRWGGTVERETPLVSVAEIAALRSQCQLGKALQ